MKYLVLVVLIVLMVTPVAVAAGPESVTFETADGLEIQGDYSSTGRKGSAGVVALHMYPGDRTSWAAIASLFTKAGIDFLAIDMRGYGGSAVQDGKDLSTLVRKRDPHLFRAMYQDALAARDFLVSRGAHPDRIALLGASVGSSVAIDAAARESGIRGVCVMTPGERYLGVPTMEHLPGLRGRPLLILSSKEEAGKGASAIKEAHGDDANLVLFDGTGIHGTRMFGKVPGVEQRIVEWFADLLGAPVALDGQVSDVEAEGCPFERFPCDPGEGTGERRVYLAVHGQNLYVAAKAFECDRPGDLFFAFAGKGETKRARGIQCVGGRGGPYVRHLVLRDGEWLPVRTRRLPGAASVAVVTNGATEMLIPLGSKRAGRDRRRGVVGLRRADSVKTS